jgi:hypothetical protein
MENIQMGLRRKRSCPWVLLVRKKLTGKMGIQDSVIGMEERTLIVFSNFGGERPREAKKCQEVHFHSGWT